MRGDGEAALDLERVASGRGTLVTGSVRVTTMEALAHQEWRQPLRRYGTPIVICRSIINWKRMVAISW